MIKGGRVLDPATDTDKIADIYIENGVVKNADGTETKIGANWTVNAAVPKALPMELNAETVGKIIGGVQKAAGVLGAIGKAVASAC